MELRKCRHCRYFEPYKEIAKDTPIGVCYRHPPVISPNDNEYRNSDYPDTHSDDFCGEWQPRQTEQKPEQTQDSQGFAMVDGVMDEVSFIRILHDEMIPKTHTYITIDSEDKKLQDILTQHITDVARCHFDLKSINYELLTSGKR